MAVIAILGDLDAAPAKRPHRALTIAVKGASVAEITAQQIPRLADHSPKHVVVWLGPADLLAGHDESFIHAEVVALCDALRQTAPQASVLIRGFPPVAGMDRQARLFNAATRATCELRDMTWQPHHQ